MTSAYIFISSPLEQFEIIHLITLHLAIIGEFILSVTNLGLYSIITVFLVIGLYSVGNNENRLVPSR